MMNAIPYGKQFINQDDIDAVVEALQSDFLTQGPRIAEFENAFAAYVGSKYAVAVSNGTAALHLCAMALGVDEQTNVITTPITFAASANCVKYCGGNVYFADIDPATYLIDLEKVEALIQSKPTNFFKGIIPVDFAGRPVNLEACRKLADKYHLWIIEDACHAPGGFFADSNNQKQSCGNGSFADMAIFSFHPVKHIASGEGGMVTTNDEALYQKLLTLRTHGITRNPDAFINDVNWANGNTGTATNTFPGWYMEMQELGYNYRLTDFQAALGSSQLKRADDGLAKRRSIAERYAAAFTNQDWLYGQSGFSEEHAYHLYVIEVKDRLGLYNHLRTKNIFPQIHYIPTHLMPYYQQQGYKLGDFPNAETYYSRCISLPMYPTLTEEEQDFVIKTIIDFYSL
jgi:UDP-4-amino-4,6-dideoxy-N-acetyl-beta-L-altrosamine transaminase